MQTQGGEQGTSWQTAAPTRDYANNVNYSHYLAKTRYKCNRCHRVFVYAKSLENHMLTCMRITPLTVKAIERAMPRVNTVQVEQQEHMVKDAIHFTDEIKQEIDIDNAPLEEPMWTYRDKVPEKTRAVQSESNIEDLIVAYQLKKPQTLEIRKNYGNLALQIGSRMSQDINTNLPQTSGVSFARNDSNVVLLSDVDERPGQSKHSTAILFSQITTSQQLNQKTSHSSFLSSTVVKHVQIPSHESSIYNNSLERRPSLKEHHQQHIEMLRFECTICQKRYASAAELERHQIRHLKLKPHKCNSCDQRFGTRFALNRHSESHMTNVRLKDASSQTSHLNFEMEHQGETQVNIQPINKAKHSNRSLLIRKPSSDVKTVGKEEPRNLLKDQEKMPVAGNKEAQVNPRSDSCDQRMFLDGSMNDTRPSQSNNSSPNSKPQNSQSDQKPPSLIGHTTPQCVNNRLYKCFLCPVECLNFRELEKHGRAQHLDRDAYKCIECLETFKQPAGIKTHVAMFHADEGIAMHGCNHCDAIFLALAGLHYHLKEHLLHKCPACQKGFATFTDLKTHVENQSDCRKSLEGKKVDLQLPSNSRPSRTAKKKDLTKRKGQQNQTWAFQGVSSKTENLSEELDDNLTSADDGASLRETSKFVANEQEELAEKAESPENSSVTKNSTSRRPRGKNNPKAKMAFKSYECQICQKSFALERSLREHLEGHKKSKIYNCDQCDASFTRSVQLNAHKTQHLEEEAHEQQDSEEDVKVHRTRKSYKCEHNGTSSARPAHECDVCKQSFDNARDLKKHLKTLKLPYKCNQCGESFEEPDDLKAHKTVHGEGLPLECRICEKSFTRERYLKRHIRRTHSKNTYKCDQCDAVFTRPDHRKAHQERHKANVCQICRKSFSMARHLKAHQKAEHQKKETKKNNVFECEQCDKSFKTPHGFKGHQAQHLQNKGHVCPLCNKSFTNRPYLKIHLEGHDGIWRYKCNLCDKSFGTSNSLEEHKNRHLGIKPHKCKKCNDAFVTIYGLRRHLSVHLADHLRKKPHDCSLCDQSFTTNAHLKRHIGRKHTPKPKSKNKQSAQPGHVKPLSCRICHKRFNRGQLLNEHLKKKHVGLRSYSCRYCVESFVTPTEIEAHLKLHLVHKCTSCRTGFSTLNELKQHLKVHEGNPANSDST